MDSAVSIVQEGCSIRSGTATHIAPERYSYDHEDEKDVRIDLAKKSDVYSYGVLLWEIRERRRPYEGQIYSYDI